MAKYVSNKTAARWNRTSDVVEAAGAGNRFVSGLYRPPRGGADAVCEELDLSVGSYRATAGATIAPGETGPIQVNGGEDCAEVIVDAVNHSECTFYLGERITAHVDKCCTAWFTGCSCCGGEQTPPDCCDRSIAICIGGELQIVSVNGGTASWDVSECCDCEDATLEITIECDPGSGNGQGQGPGPGGNTDIEATWTYTCGESESTGTIDLSSLCDDEADVEILDEIDGVCDGKLNTRFANFVEDCEPCETFESPCPDCATVETLGTDFAFTEIQCEDLEIDSCDISLSRSVLTTGDIYTIDFELSRATSEESDSFVIDVFLSQSAVLSTSCTESDGTVPAGATPTTITNCIAGDPCNCDRTVRWTITIVTGKIYNFRVRAGFIKCGPTSNFPPPGYLFGSHGHVLLSIPSGLGSISRRVQLWNDECTEC